MKEYNIVKGVNLSLDVEATDTPEEFEEAMRVTIDIIDRANKIKSAGSELRAADNKLRKKDKYLTWKGVMKPLFSAKKTVNQVDIMNMVSKLRPDISKAAIRKQIGVNTNRWVSEGRITMEMGDYGEKKFTIVEGVI